MNCSEFYKYLPFLFGYIYVFFSSFLTKANVDTLWNKVHGQGVPSRQPWHPQLLGLIELFMYLTSFVYGKPEFIFAWLAIKTVPQITYWKDHRTLFNIFLIGSSMTITFSFISFLIITLLKEDKILEAIVMGAVCMIFFVITWLYSRSLDALELEIAD